MTAPCRAREAGQGLTGAALRIARAGWWVFPVRPGGKAPAAPAAHLPGSAEALTCKGACGRWGHGLHDATNDPDVVARMWARWPRANIGLACGPSGLVVIDLDTTTGPPPDRVVCDQDEANPGWVRDAATVLTWVRQRHGGPARDLATLTVTTPSGGRHFYYRAPVPASGIRVTSGAGVVSGLGWGVDVRAAGGYVVAPPSVRAEGRYVCGGGRLQPLPAWLLGALDSAGRIARPVAPSSCDTPTRHAVADGGQRYLVAALAGEIDRVLTAPAGTLNDTVTRAAFALGQLVSGAGLDREAAVAALLDAARRSGAAHAACGGKPFAEHKTAASIARAVAAGAAHPRGPG